MSTNWRENCGIYSSLISCGTHVSAWYMYLTVWDLILFLPSYFLLKMVLGMNELHCRKITVTYFASVLQNCWCSQRWVVVLRATWCTSQSEPKKPKKIQPGKISLYFRKWNFLALILKKFLYFLKRQLVLYFLKKSFSYISGNGSTQFSVQAQKIKEIHLRKISYTLGNGNPEKISYIFAKENFSDISWNRNPQKILYISGNGTFLYSRKGIFRTLTYLELEAYAEHCNI